MSGPEKDAAIAAFREHATILLCTQAGGEGATCSSATL